MNTSNIVVYTPTYRRKTGFFQSWLIMIKNIARSRELIFQLFKRDFLMSYKKSFIGVGWLLVQPFLAIVSWVFLNATGLFTPGQVGIPYPAYVLLSSSIWSLFTGFYGSAVGTLNAGGSFILQVKYPHEALLVKQTLQHLANFSIAFIINVLVSIILFRVVPDWHIIFLPLAALPLFFLGAGIGLIMSVVSVVASDIVSGFNVLLNLVLYITPVIYAPKANSPILQKIIDINPLTYLIGGIRDLMLNGYISNPLQFLGLSVLCFLFFAFSWRIFYLSENKVIEKMI